jgi:PIN domain nuclease of toxin-antitoxin system
MIYLDTHIVVWLYQGNLSLLTQKVKNLLNNETLMISPMVRLELKLLEEIEKITVSPDIILNELHYAIGLTEYNGPMDFVIHNSLSLSWTRDPFDRIIVANAIAEKAALITKDQRILTHYAGAIWD